LQVRAVRGRALAPRSYLTAVVGDRLAVSRVAEGIDPVWNEDFEPFVLHPGDRKLEVRVCSGDSVPQATFSIPLQDVGVNKVAKLRHEVGAEGEVEIEARLLSLDSDNVIVERTAGVASAGSILFSMLFLL
jgi:IMP dehydrogenase/GMP reductase